MREITNQDRLSGMGIDMIVADELPPDVGPCNYTPNMADHHPALHLNNIMIPLTDQGFTVQAQLCDTDLFYAWKGHYGQVPVYILIPRKTMGDIFTYVIVQCDMKVKDFYLCDQGFNATVMKALELEWNPEDAMWHQTYNNMTALLTGQSTVIY